MIQTKNLLSGEWLVILCRCKLCKEWLFIRASLAYFQLSWSDGKVSGWNSRNISWGLWNPQIDSMWQSSNNYNNNNNNNDFLAPQTNFAKQQFLDTLKKIHYLHKNLPSYTGTEYIYSLTRLDYSLKFLNFVHSGLKISLLLNSAFALSYRLLYIILIKPPNTLSITPLWMSSLQINFILFHHAPNHFVSFIRILYAHFLYCLTLSCLLLLVNPSAGQELLSWTNWRSDI